MSDTPESPVKQPVHLSGPPPFELKQLWSDPIINPLNLKSYTVPIFNLNNPYTRSFHLSWLGFFVAFLSWFAFPPLLPEAINTDLGLSAAQVSNSNIVALCATLIVRFIAGPFVDHYGPRKVMATILILGAIPSGLAGVAHDAGSLYTLRFFIGILGGTFVPCQAWTSAFFDKNCVGFANAFVGGWGNMGGGATFAIMVSLFQSLVDSRGLSSHNAWRASFAIVPVPVLLFVAGLTLVFGQDHPAGKWSERHNLPATALAIKQGHHVIYDKNEKHEEGIKSEKQIQVGEQRVLAVDEDGFSPEDKPTSTVDVAVNESLTVKTALKIVSSPLTWLPALAYFTTFGLELVLDASMATVLTNLFGATGQKLPGFGQTKAGYYTSIFGFLNVVTRPLGGFLGDYIYRKTGTNGKKFLTLASGLIMGAAFLAGGLYIQNNHTTASPASLPIVMGVFSVAAIFSEIGNGVNFSLVPHCNSYNNGVMSGLVGGMGNFGGIIFAIIVRYQTAPGKAYWIIGAVCIALNVVLVLIPIPKSHRY